MRMQMTLQPNIQPLKDKVFKPLFLILVEPIVRFISYKYKLPQKKTKVESVLILPPTDPGSLGDEAMTVAIIQFLKNKDIGNIGFFKYYKKSPSYVEGADEIMLPPSLLSLVFSLPSLIQEMSHYDAFLCMGADVLDGYYSEDRSLRRLFLSDVAARIGLYSIITGFSFKENASPLVVQKFKRLSKDVKVFCRDAVSHNRLQQKVKSRSIELAADVAFLLMPNNQSEVSILATEWIRKQRSTSNLVVGFNISPHALTRIPNLEGQKLLLNRILESLKVVYEEKSGQISFVGIPHDIRAFEGLSSDVELINQIVSDMPEHMRSNTMVIPTPFKAADVKAICKELNLVLTGRMHLAIAALGQGTPALCLTYQGKFEGLFQHFSMQPLTIAPSEALEDNLLAQALSNAINSCAQLKEQIQQELPIVKKLAKENLSSLVHENRSI